MLFNRYFHIRSRIMNISPGTLISGIGVCDSQLAKFRCATCLEIGRVGVKTNYRPTAFQPASQTTGRRNAGREPPAANQAKETRKSVLNS